MTDLDDVNSADRRFLTTPPGGLGLAEGMTRSLLSFHELWLRQVSVGGTAGVLEVEAYVLGILLADRHSHDVIAQALNEHFLDSGELFPVEYWSNAATAGG